MTWMGVSIAGIGGGLSAWGSYRNAKNQADNGGYDIDPYGAMTPEQQQMMGQTGPLITARSQNADQYGGQYNSQMTDYEKQNVDRYARLGAMGEQGFGQALSGQFNEEEFQKGVAAPMADDWKRYAQPLIDEAYAGPGGGFFSTDRGEANRRSAMDMTNTIAGQRYTGIQAAKDRAISAAGVAPGYFDSVSKGLSLPRGIQDYGLEKQYQEWTRGEKQKQEYVNAALQFMNISGGTAIPKQVKPDPWAYVAGGLGQGMQSYAQLNALKGGGLSKGGGGGGSAGGYNQTVTGTLGNSGGSRISSANYYNR